MTPLHMKLLNEKNIILYFPTLIIKKLNWKFIFVLQSFPVSSSNNQRNKFNIEVISSVIKEFTSGKTWTSMNLSASDNNFLKFCNNGVVFAGKVVDRMWLGFIFMDSLNFKNFAFLFKAYSCVWFIQ